MAKSNLATTPFPFSVGWDRQGLLIHPFPKDEELFLLEKQVFYSFQYIDGQQLQQILKGKNKNNEEKEKFVTKNAMVAWNVAGPMTL